MGEVYRARDAKLGRDGRDQGPAARRSPMTRLGSRALRARSADAGRAESSQHLRHPRIRARPIGVRFLILELGRRRDASRRRLPRVTRHVRQARAAELATRWPSRVRSPSALEVAHATRDRPSRPEAARTSTSRPTACVKVLDFGLARTVGAGARTPDLTSSGCRGATAGRGRPAWRGSSDARRT